jgi:hypothetical protein
MWQKVGCVVWKGSLIHWYRDIIMFRQCLTLLPSFLNGSTKLKNSLRWNLQIGAKSEIHLVSSSYNWCKYLQSRLPPFLHYRLIIQSLIIICHNAVRRINQGVPVCLHIFANATTQPPCFSPPDISEANPIVGLHRSDFHPRCSWSQLRSGWAEHLKIKLIKLWCCWLVDMSGFLVHIQTFFLHRLEVLRYVGSCGLWCAHREAGRHIWNRLGKNMKKHIPLIGILLCVISLCPFFTPSVVTIKTDQNMNQCKSLLGLEIQGTFVDSLWPLHAMAPVGPWCIRPACRRASAQSKSKSSKATQATTSGWSSQRDLLAFRPNMSQFREPWWVSVETGIERWRVDAVFSEGLLMHAGCSRARLGGAMDS